MSGPSAAWLQPWPVSAGELGCWEDSQGYSSVLRVQLSIDGGGAG